jgi:hypothetical protein
MESANGFGAVMLAGTNGVVTPGLTSQHGPTLLVFLSAMCDLCQLAVKPLNALVEDEAVGVCPIVIMRADEHACAAFLKVFPLRVPTICDAERTITVGFAVHRAPFALFYDERGILVRKGLAEGPKDFQSLLGRSDTEAGAEARTAPQLAGAG